MVLLCSLRLRCACALRAPALRCAAQNGGSAAHRPSPSPFFRLAACLPRSGWQHAETLQKWSADTQRPESFVFPRPCPAALLGEVADVSEACPLPCSRSSRRALI